MRSDFLCGMVAVPKTFLHAHSFLSYFDYETSISRQNEFVYLPFQILCTPHIKPRVSRYKKKLERKSCLIVQTKPSGMQHVLGVLNMFV